MDSEDVYYVHKRTKIVLPEDCRISELKSQVAADLATKMSTPTKGTKESDSEEYNTQSKFCKKESSEPSCSSKVSKKCDGDDEACASDKNKKMKTTELLWDLIIDAKTGEPTLDRNKPMAPSKTGKCVKDNNPPPEEEEGILPSVDRERQILYTCSHSLCQHCGKVTFATTSAMVDMLFLQ